MEKTSLTFTGTPEDVRLAVHTWDRSDNLDCGGISDPLKTFDLAGVIVGADDSNLCHTLLNLVDDLRDQLSVLQTRLNVQAQSIRYYQNREDVAQLQADLKEAQHAAEVYRQQLDSLAKNHAQTQLDFKEAAASNVRLYNRIHNAKAALES